MVTLGVGVGVGARVGDGDALGVVAGLADGEAVIGVGDAVVDAVGVGEGETTTFTLLPRRHTSRPFCLTQE